ncbi:MAG: hypothetical protein IJM91_00800 [Lachnospiraceae bacterium]|nr:hypothetical protein [Lachnospiraceae bacterium]
MDRFGKDAIWEVWLTQAQMQMAELFNTTKQNVSLHALQKTVDIQTRMPADALNVEEKDIMVKLVMNLLDMK